jgi:MFS family permease
MTERLPSALRHTDFRRFLAARLAANFGAQMVTVAVGYQVYQLTRNPLDLGLIGLSQFLPFVVLILPAGQAADRLDRRRIVAACYATLAACDLALTWFSITGVTSPAPIFAVMAIFGTARAFNMPTGQALLPNLVPRADFGSAVAINSSALQVATIAGPAVGGLVFLAGPGVVYGIVAGLMALASLLTLQLARGGREERTREPILARELFSGIGFVRRRPVVLGSISLDLFAVLFGGATALLPVYATDILRVGPTGLGLLRAAPAIGGAACAFMLSARPLRRQVGRTMFAGVAAFGVGTIVFGVSRSFALSLLALAVMGAADMVSVYVRHLLVQLETPDEIRGRVSAVNAVFIGASNELGEFESGVTAAWFGTVPAVLVGGAATIAVAGLWTWLFPSLRRLDRFPGHPAARDAGAEIPEAAVVAADTSGVAADPEPSRGSGSAVRPR